MASEKCCETCEHYAEYKGTMQRWNRDSDYMYQDTAPAPDGGQMLLQDGAEVRDINQHDIPE